MAERWCDHCDLPFAQCHHSLPDSVREEASPVRRRRTLIADGPTISAQYDGLPCVGCGNPIDIGSSITHTEDGWAHEEEVEQRDDDGLFEGII